MPRKSKTPAHEAVEMLAFLWGGLAVGAFFGWQYNIPVVQQINPALSPYTLPWLEKSFGHVNLALERLLIRDLIWRAAREASTIAAVRDKIQFKTEKRNHAR